MKKIDPTVEHPDYEELEEKYDLCEDAFEGDVCKYVPKLYGQTEQQFKEYVNRAAYFNMVDKTTYALVGALTRKPYQYNNPFPVNEYGNGDNFLQACYRDLLLGARVCIQVDVTADGKSQLISYDADDVINWRGDGTSVGDFVVIEDEIETINPDNPFETLCIPAWRELYLDDTGYGVRVWTMTGKGKYTAQELPPMLVNGQKLAYIPLWTVNPYDNTWEVYNPPLYTLSKLNIQYFKKSVDLAHYEHYMAIPTFTVIGDLVSYTDDSGNTITPPILLGSTTQALHLTSGSDAKYVEVSGSSHGTLMNSLNMLLDNIYVAGSRLITSKKGIESAEALQIRSGSESAVLSTLVNALEGALNSALALCAEIDRVTPDVITLNHDFTAAQADPQVIQTKLALYSQGVITLEQFLQELYSDEYVLDPNQQNQP